MNSEIERTVFSVKCGPICVGLQADNVSSNVGKPRASGDLQSFGGSLQIRTDGGTLF